ncbi:Hsp33 family molecular chaperone HslO [Treponema brennaborense]|uniref:Hsp33 protein n=1 Tax=Treponema brennaborense (strain DSM 12168 / CIP 105900 / DD5/3) TaxID=906968 RepID=F4LQ60_TREBD|nr:Hsp33 family molecular chaperone HslO [Treponema brennaborense]AEE17138.1 Hsp33 protein [Treponema brennaborense DSM 12168]
MIQNSIADADLIRHLDTLEHDGMSVFVMADGKFRGAFFNGTRFINQMRANHKLGILETMILGQAYLCTALMIPTMKGRGRLTFRYDTNGPAAGFSVEADSRGAVRGYLLQNTIPVDKPLESWDLSPFFGPGTLSVTRYNENDRAPQTGSVEIKYRNIAKDLTWYFAQSEQIRTAFNTGIQFDKQGRVVGAGGMFLQAMPPQGGFMQKEAESDAQAYDDLLGAVEHAFQAAPSYGQWFAEKGTRDDIIYGLFRDFSPTTVLERDIVFDCTCSQEKYRNAILSLGAEELADIQANDPDPLEVICHNCGSIYRIPKSSLVKA